MYYAVVVVCALILAPWLFQMEMQLVMGMLSLSSSSEFIVCYTDSALDLMSIEITDQLDLLIIFKMQRCPVVLCSDVSIIVSADIVM